MKEPRPANRAGSRKKSVRPGTLPEPAPARAVLKDISSRSAVPSYMTMPGSEYVCRTS